MSAAGGAAFKNDVLHRHGVSNRLDELRGTVGELRGGTAGRGTLRPRPGRSMSATIPSASTDGRTCEQRQVRTRTKRGEEAFACVTPPRRALALSRGGVRVTFGEAAA